MPPPTNVHQIRQFIGLCNFFHNHIKDFSLISQPLHQLTRDSAAYEGGTLPDSALKAFFTIKDALISKPVVAFPRADRKFTLVSKVKLHCPTTCKRAACRPLSVKLMTTAPITCYHMHQDNSTNMKPTTPHPCWTLQMPYTEWTRLTSTSEDCLSSSTWISILN